MKFRFLKNNFIKYLKLFKILYRDKQTPKISKILIWCAIAYLACPIDLIPDFIPVIGQLDDVLIVPFLLYLAFKFIPSSLYKKHYKKIMT